MAGEKDDIPPEQHPSEKLEFATVPLSIGGIDDDKPPVSPALSSPCRTEYAPVKSHPTFDKASEHDGIKFASPLRAPGTPVSEAPASPGLSDAGGVESIPASTDIKRRISTAVTDYDSMAQESRRAAKSERHMTFLEGVRLYPKAIGWSVLLSLTIVMEGFDIALINSFYAFPTFQRNYGDPTPEGGFEISTAWQSALTNGAVVGEILGLLANGLLTSHIGNRRTMMLSLFVLALFIFMAFFASNVGILLASQVLCGLPWGVFQTLSTTYAAEVMPVALRAYLTSNVNNCWLVGQLISVCVLRALIYDPSEWSYRIPFALQWVWCVPIFLGMLFAPESPWWLIQHERDDEAKKALLRLTKRGEKKNFNPDETVAMMRHTNELEKAISEGTTYWDCFKGADLRRTEIACLVWITQSVSAVMTGYAVYFYVQAGLGTERAFDLSIGMYGAGIAGGVVAWFLMRVVGRRTLYLWGCGGCATCLIVAGIVGCVPNQSAAHSWALGSLMVLNTFLYDSTIGPVCYALVAEIPSTRLRVKTVVLARVAYNIMTVVTNVLVPKMLNPTAWNLRGKTCFLWGAGTLLCGVWCFFRLPEPKGLTYMELDILFEKKAGARKFKRVQSNLASSGYFSLQKDAHGRGERNEWHVNKG